MTRQRRRDASPSSRSSILLPSLCLGLLINATQAFHLYQRPRTTSYFSPPTSRCPSFPSTPSSPSSSSSSFRLAASDTVEAAPQSDAEGTVTVRFVNTPEGSDVVALAHEGENLMKVGDRAGLKIPRACCTGLCGTCTSDLEDPTYNMRGDSKPSSAREGYQTIRACSTQVKLPPGCEEMVIDVYRIKKKKGAKGGSEQAENPMERFSGDWETNFRQGSKWSVPTTSTSGMALRQSKPDEGGACTTCGGTGKIPCFNCKGKGVLTSGQRSLTCYICKGEGQYFCADCQATGMIGRKKV